MLDKTACMCSKTSRVDNTKSVHNRPKPAVFVRTAQGLSSNQNEVSINSKSDLWRTALLRPCEGARACVRVCVSARMCVRLCARLRVRAGACAREAVYVSVCACACGCASVCGCGPAYTQTHTRTRTRTHTHAHDGVANEGSTADISGLHGRSRWHGK